MRLHQESACFYDITVILSSVRFKYDRRKSKALKGNPRRGIDFQDVQALWQQPYYLDQRSEAPEQFRAIGWVNGKLYSVIYEVRDDAQGEYYHLITLWKATFEERILYEKNS